MRVLSEHRGIAIHADTDVEALQQLVDFMRSHDHHTLVSHQIDYNYNDDGSPLVEVVAFFA